MCPVIITVSNTQGVYDDANNITYEYGVLLDGEKTLRYHYVYDRMNQLVRADDNVSHKTYVYTYDVGGNRTATKIYDFTLETLEGEPTVITQTYGFDLDSNVMRWNDRLKTYNGKQIIYDLEGNPVSYGGKTLNWYGKQLKQVTAADGSYTQYDYDANGLRTQKTQYKADGTTDYTVDYVWSDGKIAVQSLTYPLTMTIQGNTVTRDIKIDSKFIYCDDDATPSAIMLENDEYLLVRNLQGDVVAVVNAANGETVVEFSYDPWGNVTRKYSETYTDGATEEELKLLDLVMTALCPVTYRGYNYDFTTGLYYLQSRYYNPEWGRFLNTDDTAIMLAKTDDAFSANMYLYCNNNPVNKVDYSGYYSAEKAQEYAKTWWNLRNPCYKSNDADCANFVSQCLYAGNLNAMSIAWHNRIQNGKMDISLAWGRVKFLRSWLKSSGYVREIIINSSDLLVFLTVIALYFKKPPCSFVVFMNFGNGEGYTHAVISGDVDTNTLEWYYFAHTSDRCGKKYDSFGKIQPSFRDFFIN